MQGRKVLEVWNEQQVKEQLEGRSLEQQFILAGLFGTGARLREFTSLKKENIILTEEGNLKITLKNFKNKTVHARTVLLDAELEDWLIKPILAFLQTLSKPEELCWKKSPRWLEKKVRKWFGKHPHFFRHCRSTYNYNFWGMNDMENMHFMGWSNLQPAHLYTHLKTQDLLNVFQRKKAITKQANI